VIPADAFATLADLHARATQRHGRFRVLSTNAEACCLPQALHPARITAAPAASRTIPAPKPHRLWTLRLALANRQDLWRRLRGARGLAPVVWVRHAGQGARITAFACLLDGAPASPALLDALEKMLEDAAVRRNRQWADSALSRQK
jgi:hypothetical protein